MSLFNMKSDNYDLLIITPNHFKNILKKFKQHKEIFNIQTKIVTLTEIYNSIFITSNARDKQEKIKYFIKNSIEKWNIKYVLLIGGNRQLSVRYIHNFDCYPLNLDVKEPPYISDLYYADIYDNDGNFSRWNSDNSNKYGEWYGKTAKDKNIDLRPDVSIGRLPCKNRLELKILLNKIINYEKKSYGKEWFKNIISVGGNTHPKCSSEMGGELDLEKALAYMKDFNKIKLYTSKGNLDRTNIIKSINKGCGFLVLSGHGNLAYWTTYKSNNKEFIPKFSTYHLNLLLNRYELPICIASGCRNSAFDTSPVNFIKHPYLSYYWMDCIPDCWMGKIAKRITGGSIASLGSTGLGYTKYEPITGGKADAWSYLIPRFFYEFNIKKTNMLGDIWSNVIKNYLKEFSIDWNTPSLDYKPNSSEPKPDVINARTVQQFILLGDPTLKIGGYDLDIL